MRRCARSGSHPSDINIHFGHPGIRAPDDFELMICDRLHDELGAMTYRIARLTAGDALDVGAGEDGDIERSECEAPAVDKVEDLVQEVDQERLDVARLGRAGVLDFGP